MVEHKMGLYKEGFDLIQSGNKKIEIRLNDKKRQQIKEGDIIIFYLLPERNEFVTVRICSLKKFETFKESYTKIDFNLLGRADKTNEWMLAASYDLYSREDELHFGILAIEFEKLK